MSAATATVSNLNGSGSKYIKKNSQSSSTRNQQQQQQSSMSSSVYNASSKTKQQPCIDDLDDMNNLSLSSTPLNNMRPVSSASSMKNGYPTYQATVASMTSSSAANSTGAASAILSSLSNVNGYEYDYADSPPPQAAAVATMRPLIDRPSSSSLKSSSSLMSSSSCSSTTPATITTAFKLEHFDIMNTVGTGTFGRVLVVKHKQTKDYYALKVMSISEVLRLKQTDHVRNEKQILQQIRHPFIINL